MASRLPSAKSNQLFILHHFRTTGFWAVKAIRLQNTIWPKKLYDLHGETIPLALMRSEGYERTGTLYIPKHRHA